MEAIARKNDGTFENVVLNIQRVRKTGERLTLANYIPTLNGSWREVYERAVAKHPAVEYIYDAIDLLRPFRIELYSWIIEPTALLFGPSKRPSKATRERQVKRALKYLVQEKIMAVSDGKFAPRDGQIEAKGIQVVWEQYLESLKRLILRLATRRHIEIFKSLDGFSFELISIDDYEGAVAMSARATKLAPQDAELWKNLGISLYVAGAGSLEQVLAMRDPTQLAEVVPYAIRRLKEAEETYHRAIECGINHEDVHPWIAKLYAKWGEYLAIYYRQFPEAEDTLRLAIKYDRETALENIRDNVLWDFDIIIRNKPEDFNSRLYAASISREIGDTEAMHKYCDEARELIPFGDWYNLARLESILGNADIAYEHLLRATEQESFDPAKAQHDPALSWIRNDPRFSEMVVVSTDILDDTEDDSEE
jgi:tetratricopeptide (TPR) repeat protein